MYISTTTNYFKELGDYKNRVACMKECGFDAYDFTFENDYYAEKPFGEENYIENAKAFRKYSESLGIVCHQTHAPFPTAKVNDDVYNKDIFTKIVHAIEISGLLGAKVCVVHPSVEHSVEENIRLYQALEPYAKKADVKIGVENMTRDIGSHPTHIKAILDGLSEDVFVFCLDTGHAEMAQNKTSAVEMIRTMKNRLQAVHLHDCDLIRDNHGLPFTYKINFDAVIAEMKKVGYQGDVMLETGSFFSGVPMQLLPAYAKLAAKVASYIREQLQK